MSLFDHWILPQRAQLTPPPIHSLGHASAHCICRGLSYVTNDPRRAAELFKCSADLGSADGQAQLAACHFQGNGVSKDVDEAVRLYRSLPNSHCTVQLTHAYTCRTNTYTHPYTPTTLAHTFNTPHTYTHTRAHTRHTHTHKASSRTKPPHGPVGLGDVLPTW